MSVDLVYAAQQHIEDGEKIFIQIADLGQIGVDGIEFHRTKQTVEIKAGVQTFIVNTSSLIGYKFLHRHDSGSTPTA